MTDGTLTPHEWSLVLIIIYVVCVMLVEIFVTQKGK